MVRILCFFFLFFAFLAAQPLIEVEVEGTPKDGLSPFGLITITHQGEEVIDENSFKLGAAPLHVTLVDKIPMTAGDVTVSHYRFTLDPKPKGLHLLPAIQAEVGGNRVASIPIAYEVKSTGEVPKVPLPLMRKKAAARIIRKPDRQPADIIFRLEAGLKGPKTLYPGQKAKLYYKITYNRDIDLTASQLPFVHALPFKKVGDARIQDYQQGGITVQEIVQEIEAFQAGQFAIGPSQIAGYAYQLNNQNQKKYLPPLLRSQAPALSIEVRPFPKKDQPPSFTGALGKIDAKLHMNTPNERGIGDKVELQLTLSNVENLADLKLPDFFCQPGISGFFQSHSLLPPGNIEQGSKQYTIEMRVISQFANAIPSLEFSSFDPSSGIYVVRKTDPIPLQIKATPLRTLTTSGQADQSNTNPLLWDPSHWPLAPLEMQGRAVPLTGLYLPWFESLYTLLLIPMGAAWIALQYYLKKHQPPPRPLKTSERWLQEAQKKSLSDEQAAATMEKALWWKAWEEGILPMNEAQLEEIPEKGAWGEVKELIYNL
ncbi:MAG: hypothetical protein LW832_04295, partial [Parachlamydia sp.]|nr:hypothetical protein [Parachlamydia sp.]